MSILKMTNFEGSVYLEIMTKPDLKFIGSRIKQARNDSGMTQAEVGAILELTQGMINKIEAGQSAIKLVDLFKLAEVFNRPLAYFLGIDVGGLSAEEGELVDLHRSLPEGLPREYGLNLLKSWAAQFQRGRSLE